MKWRNRRRSLNVVDLRGSVHSLSIDYIDDDIEGMLNNNFDYIIETNGDITSDKHTQLVVRSHLRIMLDKPNGIEVMTPEQKRTIRIILNRCTLDENSFQVSSQTGAVEEMVMAMYRNSRR